MRDQAKLFDAPASTANELQRMGENAYPGYVIWGRKEEGLHALCSRGYYEKVTTKVHQIHPPNLPTAGAAEFPRGFPCEAVAVPRCRLDA